MTTTDALPQAVANNATLDLICRRSSTRVFADTPVDEAQRQAVLHAATRAPSGGAMMMYSIIDIRRRETIERLAVLCDNQPFIAKAPWALVFVVDYAKWMDLFAELACADAEGTGPRPPQRGELAIAAQDTVAAAQTAVIAAEAVGLGSCYIGDVVEHAEEVAAPSTCRPTRCRSRCWSWARPTKSGPPHRIQRPTS